MNFNRNGYLNSRNIYVQKYDVGLGKRIVQLTDVHIGPANRENRVEKVIQITNKLKPDIVLITGDLADMSTKLDSHMFDSLKKIKAPKYMIHGNHEFYDGKKKIEEQLKTADIKILNDESVYIKDLTILGADYKSDPEIVINKTKIKGKSILMIHEPLGEKAAAKHKIDLVLSGHTHGGQFFPFTIFVNLFFKFTRGIHDYKGSKIIVSMGTLTWGPQVRIGSRNQIIVID
ncbi:metallophosphoesterase [archaeon]|nr:metallophosphoesterase [archaeon]MBT4021967.1 metallophosphoesterase [archaeon]MBT7440124.1 metallophosphoesterase [archaeon]